MYVRPSNYKQRYPSGQRGWDEVPVRSASQVQILSSAPPNSPMSAGLNVVMKAIEEWL